MRAACRNGENFVATADQNDGLAPKLRGEGNSVGQLADGNALFGAEISGHYFYRALGGGDDGLYTACLVIEHLGRSGRSLAELRRQCPQVFMTPDLRIAAPSARFSIMLRG